MNILNETGVRVKIQHCESDAHTHSGSGFAGHHEVCVIFYAPLYNNNYVYNSCSLHALNFTV